VILLWGLGDTVTTAVAGKLLEDDRGFVFVDQRLYASTDLHAISDGQTRVELMIDGTLVDMDEVAAAFIRPYDASRLPSEGLSRGESHARRCNSILWAWADVTAALVLNRPSAMAGCSSKLLQFAQILRSGFAVPETLVTTDPAEAEVFWMRHKSLVYKSMSGVRSVVCAMTKAHRLRLADLRNCPTQFQEYVPGRDYRVHIVDAELFCCEVVSDSVDYRYAGKSEKSVEIRWARLPDPVADQCLALATAMQLPLAGIDLRHTPDGRWYCFETNPSPAFTYYDRDAQQPIATAVARLLARPT